jgi:hypothetical protein
VDHAIASGLLLFQYASYWYWVLQQVKSDDTDVYNELTTTSLYSFNYSPSNLTTDILPACRAAAYHNVLPQVPGSESILNEMTLDRDPIMFLGILCDELQRWDRLPAGPRLLDKYRSYEGQSLASTDISLNAQDVPLCGPLSMRKARFTVMRARAFVDAIVRALDERLIGWQDLIQVGREGDWFPV